MTNEQHYLYDGCVVRKTSRTAEKVLPSGKKDQLFEITPVDTTTGSWKKWVRDGELYTIKEDE